MPAFPLDRLHPPRRLLCTHGDLSLVLRPWALPDVDAMQAALRSSLPELRAFLTWAHAPESREAVYDVVAKFHASYWAGREYVLGAFDADGGVVGGVGLHPRVPLNPRGLEVGYWMATPRAGKGYATLATRMLTALAFDWFDCDRLQILHDEANGASGRVIAKCGFVLEGVVRRAIEQGSMQMLTAGYRGTERQRLYSLVPDDLPSLPWLPAIRSALVVEDAFGAAYRGEGPSSRQQIAGPGTSGTGSSRRSGAGPPPIPSRSAMAI
jgi:RimJ/RimL family protein N-acetyltransferase